MDARLSLCVSLRSYCVADRSDTRSFRFLVSDCFWQDSLDEESVHRKASATQDNTDTRNTAQDLTEHNKGEPCISLRKCRVLSSMR